VVGGDGDELWSHAAMPMRTIMATMAMEKMQQRLEQLLHILVRRFCVLARVCAASLLSSVPPWPRWAFVFSTSLPRPRIWGALMLLRKMGRGAPRHLHGIGEEVVRLGCGDRALGGVVFLAGLGGDPGPSGSGRLNGELREGFITKDVVGLCG
jgi:hypothetical protein